MSFPRKVGASLSPLPFQACPQETSATSNQIVCVKKDCQFVVIIMFFK